MIVIVIVGVGVGVIVIDPVIVAVHLNVNATVEVIGTADDREPSSGPPHSTRRAGVNGVDHAHGAVPVHVHGHDHGPDHVNGHDHGHEFRGAG